MPTLKKMTKESIVYFKNERKQTVYLIKKGSVVIDDPDIAMESIDFKSQLNDGDLFGIDSAILNIPRQETARCLIDSELIIFDKSEFDDLLSTNPQIGIKILLNFSTTLRKLSDREKILNSKRSLVSFESAEKAMFITGVLLLNQGKKQQALDVFKRFVKSYPLYPLVTQAQSHIKTLSYDLAQGVSS